jgi:uncharacterized protein YbjT (DUF2867 family)
MQGKKTLVIAGATGFIGRWFINKYKKQYRIIALSRKKVKQNENPEVEWRQVELYSITSTEQALAGADYALYLVHSMTPSTRLNQGSFDDTDLLLADNFARAAEKHELEQIIFVGGILPKESKDFSRHLRSRYEVEQTLGGRSVPLTTLRAGIIIGPGGSSFTIVEKLVQNLPIMACPKWCDSLSQPIAVDDVLTILHHAFGNKDWYHQAVEVGGPDVVSYTDLLRLTAKLMKKKRLIFSVPIYTVGFSKLWVARFTQSSTTLVSPLVESLRHTVTVEPNPLLENLEISYLSIEEMVKQALERSQDIYTLPSFDPNQHVEKNTVRSYQRLPNPRKIPAHRVAKLYQRWLPNRLKYLVNAKLNGPHVSFYLFFMRKPILTLSLVEDRSDHQRQLFYITAGALVKRKDYGWLEFRKVLNGRYIIAAIHEFVPTLPWLVYLNTQAVVHLWVMKRFGRYLKNV